jgi:hypothetical protein
VKKKPVLDAADENADENVYKSETMCIIRLKKKTSFKIEYFEMLFTFGLIM